MIGIPIVKYYSSWAYYIVSLFALLSAALPLAPYIELETKKELITLGFPIAIALALIAALILNFIRAHAAALRLLKSHAGESKEKNKDKEVIKKLLQEIHTPTFDDFIHYGRGHFLYGDIIHYWEGFNARVIASNFHIYNEQHRAIVLKLHGSWQKCLSFGKYFKETNNFKIQKFDSRGIHKDAEESAAYHGFIEAVENTDENFRALIAVVHNEYQDIDIEATNAVALNDFRSYQISMM